MKIDDLVYYHGRQYQLGQLPAGVDTSEVVPLDEWYASQRHDIKSRPKATTGVVVGEHGPEVFVPAAAGSVSPSKGGKRK